MNNNQVLCKHCEKPIQSRKDLTLASINTTPHPIHKLCYIEMKGNSDWKTNLFIGPPINIAQLRQPWMKRYASLFLLSVILLGTYVILGFFTLKRLPSSLQEFLALLAVFLFIVLVIEIPLACIIFLLHRRVVRGVMDIESRLPEEHQ